jgi:hypothetical protein
MVLPLLRFLADGANKQVALSDRIAARHFAMRARCSIERHSFGIVSEANGDFDAELIQDLGVMALKIFDFLKQHGGRTYEIVTPGQRAHSGEVKGVGIAFTS